MGQVNFVVMVEGNSEDEGPLLGILQHANRINADALQSEYFEWRDKERARLRRENAAWCRKAKKALGFHPHQTDTFTKVDALRQYTRKNMQPNRPDVVGLRMFIEYLLKSKRGFRWVTHETVYAVEEPEEREEMVFDE